MSPHFSFAELTFSQTAARFGINNEPGFAALCNLQRTAWLLEEVRVVLDDAPIVVTSAYRSYALNIMIGGSKTSAHLHGPAADFTAPGFGTPYMICSILANSDIEYDELILEYDRWVHISWRDSPRRRVRTICDRGEGYQVGLRPCL